MSRTHSDFKQSMMFSTAAVEITDEADEPDLFDQLLLPAKDSSFLTRYLIHNFEIGQSSSGNGSGRLLTSLPSPAAN